MKMDLNVRFLGPAAVVASPFLGSFICCAIDRMPNSVDVTWCRSRCDGCGTILRAADLVPILSYLSLGGKCRSCKATIPPCLLGAEIGIVLLTASAVWFSSPQQLPIAIAFTWILFALAAFDVAHGRLPDALTIPLCALGLGWSALGSAPVSTIGSIGGMLSGVLVSLFIAMSYQLATHRSGLGGGDIKLFGASGAWIGWQALPTLLVLASLTALSVATLSGRRSRTDRLPFGPFIVFATFAIWCWQIAR